MREGLLQRAQVQIHFERQGVIIKIYLAKEPPSSNFECDHAVEIQWLKKMTNTAIEERSSPLCEGLFGK